MGIRYPIYPLDRQELMLYIFLGFQDLRVTSDHGKEERQTLNGDRGNLTFRHQHRFHAIDADVDIQKPLTLQITNEKFTGLSLCPRGPWLYKIISGKVSWPSTYRRVHLHHLALVYTSVISAGCINRQL